MRTVLAAIGAMMLAAGGVFPACADNYPTRSVRIIVPFLPGAGTDLSARIMAEALAPRLGQPVVVENRAGAGGAIGSDYVAKSPADGYTLLWGEAGGVTILPNVKPSLPYKVNDFSYIAKFVETGMSYVISSRLPAVSLPEFIAYGKANPGTIRYGSSGVGASPHLATLLFEKNAGLKMTHVPYKGVAAALNDLMGGHIEFLLVTPVTIVPHLGSDKIRVVGISSPSRHPFLPKVPTMKESGLPQATVMTWYGLLGPARIPAPVMERLRKEITAVVESPAIRERLEKIGLQLAPLYGGEFEKSAFEEHRRWKAIAEAERIVVTD
mgnify:CR=1 FL=1